MGPRIKRECFFDTFALTTDATTTAEIDINCWSMGEVFIPTGSSITSLTWHAAPGKGGTYLPAQDASGSAVTQTVAQTKSYPIPAVLFGSGSLRIVANAAGNVQISLKS